MYNKIVTAVTALLLAIAALLSPAAAQFRGYFDVSNITIPEFKGVDWTAKTEDMRLRFVCVNFERCPLPTVVDIKGVNRADDLPAAFETGDITPEKLMAQGKANERNGSQFLKAEAITVGGVKGVHMEASANMGGEPVYFVTRWLGEGNRMLDVKATARKLDQARELAETATRSAVPQVFGKK